MVAGWDNLLPRWFTTLHPRYRTPVNSILFVGLVAMAFGAGGIAGVGEQEAFQLLDNAAGIFYGLTYLVMFAIPLIGMQRHGAPAAALAARRGDVGLPGHAAVRRAVDLSHHRRRELVLVRDQDFRRGDRAEPRWRCVVLERRATPGFPVSHGVMIRSRPWCRRRDARRCTSSSRLRNRSPRRQARARCDSIVAAARVDSVPAGLFISVGQLSGAQVRRHQLDVIANYLGAEFVAPRPFRLTVFSGPPLTRILRPLCSDSTGILRAPSVTGVFRFTSPKRGSAPDVRTVRASLMAGFDSAAISAIHGLAGLPSGFTSR